MKKTCLVLVLVFASFLLAGCVPAQQEPGKAIAGWDQSIPQDYRMGIPQDAMQQMYQPQQYAIEPIQYLPAETAPGYATAYDLDTFQRLQTDLAIAKVNLDLISTNLNTVLGSIANIQNSVKNIEAGVAEGVQGGLGKCMCNLDPVVNCVCPGGATGGSGITITDNPTGLLTNQKKVQYKPGGAFKYNTQVSCKKNNPTSCVNCKPVCTAYAIGQATGSRGAQLKQNAIQAANCQGANMPRAGYVAPTCTASYTTTVACE